MRTFIGFILFCLLLIFCWPLAVLALIAFPVIWLVCLPFRVGFWILEGCLGFIRGLLLLPARLVGGLKS